MIGGASGEIDVDVEDVDFIDEVDVVVGSELMLMVMEISLG